MFTTADIKVFFFYIVNSCRLYIVLNDVIKKLLIVKTQMKQVE